MASWREKNPTWQYRAWGNEDVELAPGEPWGLRVAWDKMKEWNGRADILRLLVLQRFGGFFVDADSLCLRPIPDAWLECEAFAAYENERHLPGTIATGYIGSIPGGSLVTHVIAEIERRSKRWDWAKEPAWRSVGPLIFTEIAKQHPELKILPARHLLPEHYSGVPPLETGESPYAMQFWGSTIHSPHYQYRGLS